MSRALQRRTRFWLAPIVACAVATACPEQAGSVDAGSSDGPALDAGLDAGAPRAALFNGAGIWAEGLTGLRDALSAAGFATTEVSARGIQGGVLADHDLLVMGGGYAYDQWQDLGDAGITAIRDFVLGGGGYLGICAGTYLAADDVVWLGEPYPYPLNLFDGVADGPVDGLPAWPGNGWIKVNRNAGDHPLQGAGDVDVLYFGGPKFLPRDITAVAPLLSYQGGAIAALAQEAGAGRVVLSAVHPEITTAQIGEDGGSGEVHDNRPLLASWARWAVRRQ